MDIKTLCLELGASNAGEAPVEKLVLSPELRALCDQNACGKFADNHTCPPLVGEVDKLIEKLKTFTTAVIWQNIFPLEDSFDFEGMMDAQKTHNAMTLEIARRVRAELGGDNALILAAGGCSLCEKCAAMTGEPCRNPLVALASLEAYGVNVSATSEAFGMKYINGANTVTYFSGVFTRR